MMLLSSFLRSHSLVVRTPDFDFQGFEISGSRGSNPRVTLMAIFFAFQFFK